MLKKMKLKNLSTFVHPHPMLLLILQLVPTILWLDHNRLNLFLVINVELTLFIIVNDYYSKHSTYNDIFIKLQLMLF
jgi:hypothetical protein